VGVVKKASCWFWFIAFLVHCFAGVPALHMALALQREHILPKFLSIIFSGSEIHHDDQALEVHMLLR
jgi:hypothetical protein